MDIIGALYQQLLHRSADTSGLQGFIAAMQKTTVEAVVASLAGSDEYYQLAAS